MSAIKSLLTPHERDLGDGIIVRRFLPAQAERSVGPFVFLDHLGPVTLAPGTGLNVRPPPISVSLPSRIFSKANWCTATTSDTFSVLRRAMSTG